MWTRLHHELPRRLCDAGRIDWNRAYVDSSSIAAKKGALRRGPNPTDRGRPGTKRHLGTDAKGIPLAFLLTGANVYDSVPFEELIDTIPAVTGKRVRPCRRPGKLHADKPTITDAAAMPARAGISSRASPAEARRPRRNLAAIDGSSNEASHGSTASEGSPSDTNAASTSIMPSPQMHVHSSACARSWDGFEGDS